MRASGATRRRGGNSSAAAISARAPGARSGNQGSGGFGSRRAARGVVQHLDDLVVALDVDGGVVDLGQQREAALGQVDEGVQAFDDVDLPQRAVQVERARMDARGLDAELPPVARCRQGDVAHVVFEVEVLVVDPVGEVQFQRHALELAAEHR
jgi:PAS domain-containing protein